VSFYVSTATFCLLHCDEWYRVVALPGHKFVTGATLLQLVKTEHNTQVFMEVNGEYIGLSKLEVKISLSSTIK
jgi:hypothetical protein